MIFGVSDRQQSSCFYLTVQRVFISVPLPLLGYLLYSCFHLFNFLFTSYCSFIHSVSQNHRLIYFLYFPCFLLSTIFFIFVCIFIYIKNIYLYVCLFILQMSSSFLIHAAVSHFNITQTNPILTKIKICTLILQLLSAHKVAFAVKVINALSNENQDSGCISKLASGCKVLRTHKDTF